VISFYPASDFFVEKILDKCGEKLLRGIPRANRFIEIPGLDIAILMATKPLAMEISPLVRMSNSPRRLMM